jgi:hypothetical protein
MGKAFPDPDPADCGRPVTGDDYQSVLIRLIRHRGMTAIEEDATPAWMSDSEQEESAFGTRLLIAQRRVQERAKGDRKLRRSRRPASV